MVRVGATADRSQPARLRLRLPCPPCATGRTCPGGGRAQQSEGRDRDAHRQRPRYRLRAGKSDPPRSDAGLQGAVGPIGPCPGVRSRTPGASTPHESGSRPDRPDCPVYLPLASAQPYLALLSDEIDAPARVNAATAKEEDEGKRPTPLFGYRLRDDLAFPRDLAREVMPKSMEGLVRCISERVAIDDEAVNLIDRNWGRVHVTEESCLGESGKQASATLRSRQRVLQPAPRRLSGSTTRSTNVT